MVLHGFVSRNPKNTVFNQKPKNTTKNINIQPQIQKLKSQPAVRGPLNSPTRGPRSNGPRILTPVRVGARAGLGPSPGWGPVRVGAHMGP